MAGEQFFLGNLCTFPTITAVPRFRVVDLDTAGNVQLANATTGIGVSQDTSYTNGLGPTAVPVMLHGTGITRVEAGTAAINIGDKVSVDSTGRALGGVSSWTWLTTAYLGRALTSCAASAAGTIVYVVTGV